MKLHWIRWMNYRVTNGRYTWHNYPIIFQRSSLIIYISFRGFQIVQYWKPLFGEKPISRTICKYILCNFCRAKLYVICTLFAFLVMTSRPIFCWYNENLFNYNITINRGLCKFHQFVLSHIFQLTPIVYSDIWR